MQWQKACSELERIGRLLRAWEWTEGRDRVARKEADIGKKEQDVVHVKKEKERHLKELQNAEKECAEVKAKREEEMKKGRLTMAKRLMKMKTTTGAVRTT